MSIVVAAAVAIVTAIAAIGVVDIHYIDGSIIGFYFSEKKRSFC